MVANQSLKNGVFQKMTENEKELILHHFNNTKTDYPKDKTLHQLFEEQAEKTLIIQPSYSAASA
ncbi:hypothetical protein QKW52_19925 [Bacillus sonorensis]|nr:hypothetical protein [Bacillus sonorensis]